MEKKGSIPDFASIEVEAAFWDSHSTADYETEFETVGVRFARPLSHALAVRLDADTLADLRHVARERGIGPSTLIRMWVLDRLHDEALPGQPRAS